jgi:predicted Rossmann fold nucleotide-binding protein DprA/Smf involved in DNA uptake
MKKIFLITLLISIIMVVSGCATSYDEAVEKGVVNEDYGNGYFVTITEWDDSYSYYSIVYAKDTKVKYFIFSKGDQGGITPLLNADGTPQVYLSDN